MFDWLIGSARTQMNHAPQLRQLEYRMKRIEAKLDLIMSEMGVVWQLETLDVVLVSDGGKKLATIRTLIDELGYSLVEAKNLVENLPSPIARGVSEHEAQEIKLQLGDIGHLLEFVAAE